MGFFERQEKAQRNTKLLGAYFIASASPTGRLRLEQRKRKVLP